MKPSIAIILCLLVLGVDNQRWFQLVKEGGHVIFLAILFPLQELGKCEAKWKNLDTYFHARGNYDAAQRGQGGAWAAKVISDARDGIQRFIGQRAADSRADQSANRLGQSGKDFNLI
ncbi:hypothetical protein U0070_024689 [Myodes glareolus]|uniref:Serum amyloid A protein n=1 Tax=Myodes glareolus TaxID=447135 RepID=A0AAW0GXI2_MYOGA